jgi:hypothetical protein
MKLIVDATSSWAAGDVLMAYCTTLWKVKLRQCSQMGNAGAVEARCLYRRTFQKVPAVDMSCYLDTSEVQIKYFE